MWISLTFQIGLSILSLLGEVFLAGLPEQLQIISVMQAFFVRILDFLMLTSHKMNLVKEDQ